MEHDIEALGCRRESGLSVDVEGIGVMAVINSSGFDPDIHIDNSDRHVAEVRSSSRFADPYSHLRLSQAGLAWARELMVRRPYFREHWTLKERNNA